MRAAARLTTAVAAVCLLGCLALAARPAPKESPRPSLAKALAALKVPPAWFATTAVRYDTSKPWKDARIEIRRLLGLGDQDSLKQAMKLTCIYNQKKDIGNGHEYPMYLFLGGEMAWALQAYEAYIQKLVAENAEGDTGAYLSLAACYRHFGEHAKAVQAATLALQRLPKPPWRISSEAHVYDALGDIYADMGDAAKARLHYRKAAQLYPTSDEPYGRHLLPRRVAKVQGKLDMLDLAAIQPGSLTDGAYTGSSLGYVDEVRVTVVIQGGRIADVKLQHKENIPLGSTEILPKRIVAMQSLNVQAVTGATTTCDAIRDGALQALRQAGLK